MSLVSPNGARCWSAHDADDDADARRTEAVEYTSELHSVILIDGKGQGKQGGRCPAGRTISFADSGRAVFAAADARWAYSHMLVSADHKEAKPVTVSPNDSRIEKSPLPWMSQPWNVLPNWATGCKPAPKQDPGGHGFWIDYNPVQYAYRTVGLIRGKHPYVLVLDDVWKDDAPHLYSWLMQVEDDVELTHNIAGDPAKSRALDLILSEKQVTSPSVDGGARDRRLLVRVLSAGQGTQEAKLTQSEGKLETYENKVRNGTQRLQRLNLPLRSTTGPYLVLLYPHRAGQPMPQTAWSADGITLTVSWPDQKDVFNLAPSADGRTRCELAPADQR